jgi:hypothetical protein
VLLTFRDAQPRLVGRRDGHGGADATQVVEFAPRLVALVPRITQRGLGAGEFEFEFGAKVA